MTLTFRSLDLVSFVTFLNKTSLSVRIFVYILRWDLSSVQFEVLATSTATKILPHVRRDRRVGV